MKKLSLQCTLLSDVIINQKTATEGSQETLDFIPGSNFLGIVAGELYSNLPPEESLLLFHSGKVKFGDAHPSSSTTRGLRIPAAWYTPKDETKNDVIWIHHLTDFEKDDVKKWQPKQCRSGFYLFEDSTAREIKIAKTFAIKSAYDREKRRSKDEQMFGYQSIGKGVVLSFDISVEDNISVELLSKIKESIVGSSKRVGRSRTAQYGLVKIEVMNDWRVVERCVELKSSEVVIYAEGRLIFLDKNGLPTFQPKVEDFGLHSGSINWSKSQIRTFQYAPWNFKRHARDNDRCGIEKGSVLVIDSISSDEKINLFVGKYQNEGFGKIMINPEFLIAKEGLANYKFSEESKLESKSTEPEDLDKKLLSEIDNLKNNDSPLLNYLAIQKEEKGNQTKIYNLVNDFVKKNENKFTQKAFASQWGNIRNIAMKYQHCDEIKNNIKIYVTHGVAAEKWAERGRLALLDEFMGDLNNDTAKSGLINLASEMGKICSKQGGKQ